MLPTAAIRKAMEADQLDVAMELIAHHERDVRAALAAPSTADHSAWLGLLAEQNALLAHLKFARSQAAEALQRLKSNHDSVRAYRETR
ncbi:hypothetical protein INQ40_03540 [Lysobacter sp. H21R4]|nr:hypothetical protein INQ40_03540 [Lysobacter sp. H21R4]